MPWWVDSLYSPIAAVAEAEDDGGEQGGEETADENRDLDVFVAFGAHPEGQFSNEQGDREPDAAQ